MNEFELIRRCFRDRAIQRPGTVLGIGDDSALLDTGGAPPVHAWATVAFSKHDDAAGTARCVFGAAFVRLAARAVTPRWTTLGLTFEPGDPDWIESFAAAAAAVCDACAVELVGGDTTCGPGRATVFALGAMSAPTRRSTPAPPAGTVTARLPLATADRIANLVSVCTDLAARGADIRCDVPPAASEDTRAGIMEVVAHTDAAGMDALRAVAGRGPSGWNPRGRLGE